jgi:anhydro-N-acetylmuramic acid kinase
LQGYLPADILATACSHIATQVAKALTLLPRYEQEHRMLVTGGGAHNDFLMNCIAGKLLEKHMKVKMETISSETIEFKEAISFAFLGLLCLRGEVNVSRTTTGATKDSVSGSLHWPIRR